MKDKHHFVPASYLAGFSSDYSRNGLLYIYDKVIHKVYRNACENVGYKKKYYKINAPGLDEDAVENAFAKVESASIPIIRTIASKRTLPVGEDYKTLMYYLALFGSRVPAIRNNINKGIEDIIKTIGKVYFSNVTPICFLEDFVKAGVDPDKIPDLSEMKDFVFSDDYYIEIDQTYQVSMILFVAKAIYEQLLSRNWCVAYRTKNMNNSFVTSDCPLLIAWKEHIPRFYSPGFGLENTRVIFPVDRDTLLIGEFEEIPASIMRISNRLIRFFNTYQTIYSERFIYSFFKEFGLLDKNRKPMLSSSIFT